MSRSESLRSEFDGPLGGNGFAWLQPALVASLLASLGLNALLCARLARRSGETVYVAMP